MLIAQKFQIAMTALFAGFAQDPAFAPDGLLYVTDGPSDNILQFNATTCHFYDGTAYGSPKLSASAP